MDIILDRLPEILLYIIPGLFAVYTFRFATETEVNNSTVIILSAAISYVTLSAVQVITDTPVQDIAVFPTAILCSAIDLFLGALFSSLIRTRCVSSITTKLFSMVPYKGSIKSIVDWTGGTNVEIYLKGRDYWLLGHLETVGDGDGDRWICIQSPIKYDQSNNIVESFEDRDDIHFAISMSDVEYIKILT